MNNKNTSGGSACKYIKKSKHCITPCKVVHNKNTKHKWYCKKTKRCSGKRKSKNTNKTKKTKKSYKIKKTKKSVSSLGEEKIEKIEKKETIEKIEEKPDSTSFTNVAANTITNITKAATDLVNPPPPKV